MGVGISDLRIDIRQGNDAKDRSSKIIDYLEQDNEVKVTDVHEYIEQTLRSIIAQLGLVTIFVIIISIHTIKEYRFFLVFTHDTVAVLVRYRHYVQVF